MAQASTYPLGTSGTALGVDGAGTVKRFTIREVLTGNRTYYVATTGSDTTGDGLASGTALATVQGALNRVAQIDFNGYTVTVQCAAGAYSGQCVIPVTVGQGLPANLIITSASGVASDVTLSANLNYVGIIDVGAGARVRVTNLTLSGASTSTHLMHAFSGGQIEFSNVTFAGSAAYQVFAEFGGYITNALGSYSYSVTGGAYCHWAAENAGTLFLAQNTITITGTPAFSGYWAQSDRGGIMRVDGNTFNGSITGTRYGAYNNGIVDTRGAGATYLPGTNGYTNPGGLYL